MSQELNLNQLREVAKEATPGPWIIDELESGEHGLFVDEDNPDYQALGCGSSQVAGFMEGKNARHIATFSPPTVLALLDRLQAAESVLARYIVERTRFGEALTKDAVQIVVDAIMRELTTESEKRARNATVRAEAAESKLQAMRELAEDKAWNEVHKRNMADFKAYEESHGHTTPEGLAGYSEGLEHGLNIMALKIRALEGDTHG